jgi:hypothetical protein
MVRKKFAKGLQKTTGKLDNGGDATQNLLIHLEAQDIIGKTLCHYGIMRHLIGGKGQEQQGITMDKTGVILKTSLLNKATFYNSIIQV